MRILVTGASGYAGQFLLEALVAAGHCVSFTFFSNPLSASGVSAFKVNLANGDGLAACLASARPQAVIHAAAVSQPAVCERDEDAARQTNVPFLLCAALKNSVACTADDLPLFILFSSDQVYDGTRSWWSEEDVCCPVNAYGRSKLAAERLLTDSWPSGRHISLRCSLIYGPPRQPVGRPLFVQWLDGALKAGNVDVFDDEWRCPVLVNDICALVLALLNKPTLLKQHPILNVGGPQRMSRADMGDAVARLRGWPRERVVRVASASISRPFKSPGDISMVTTKCAALVRLTSFEDGLRRCFELNESK